MSAQESAQLATIGVLRLVWLDQIGVIPIFIDQGNPSISNQKVTYCGWTNSISRHRSETRVSDDSPVNVKSWCQPWFGNGADFVHHRISYHLQKFSVG